MHSLTRSLHSLTIVALAALVWALPLVATAQSEVLIKEVISREIGVFVGADPDLKEMISREVGLFVGADPDHKEIVSREVSLCHVSPEPPAAITGLAFTVTPTGNEVTLNWSSYDQWAVRDVAHYAVYYSTTPFTNVTGLTPVRVVPGENFATTLTNLPEWQDHFVAVVAVDALGNQLTAVASRGIYVVLPEVISREVGLFVGADPDYREVISREVSLASVDAAAPPAVAGLVVTSSPSGKTVNLNWASYNQWAVRDVHAYRIYWSSTAFTDVTAMTPFATVPGETFTWSGGAMPEWQDHFFAVVAVDALGNANPAVTYSGVYILSKEVISREIGLFVGENPGLKEVISREVTLINPSAAVPAPVTGISSGFTVSTSVKQYGALDLNWTSYDEWAQRDVVRYRVYTADAFFSDVTGMTPVLVANGLQTFTLTGMGPEQIKYVAVVAEDALGQFNPAVYAVSAQSSVPLLGEVGNLTATALPYDIALAWDLGGVGTNLAVFTKEFRLYLDGASVPVIIPASARSWRISGLSQGTTHSARLTTVDIFGAESPGLTVSGTTLTSNPGARDSGFSSTGANGEVYTAAGTMDGRIVLGGAFSNVGGSTRNRIARLNGDGSLDATFNPNANGNIWAVFVFGDGSMLVAGEFTSIAGVSRNRLVKLNSDGTLDVSFACSANAVVHNIVPLPSGDFLIGGDFTSINGSTRNRIARITKDGSLDNTFNASFNGRVKAIGLQEDGRIVAGGSFTNVNGVARSHLVRLNADGTSDSAFTATSADHPRVIMVQPDGKVLVGGSFTSIAGVSRQRLIRLNPDGTVDSEFNTEANGVIYGFGLQTDGRIIVAGDFTTIGGASRNRLARLRGTGALDETFNCDVNGLIDGCALLQDGRIMIFGAFTQVAGVTVNRLSRLANEPATNSVTIVGNTVRLTRGGSSPESGMVVISHAPTAAGPWTPRGAATRAGSHWEYDTASLPPIGVVRMGAAAIGGLYAGSGQMIETSLSYSRPAVSFVTASSIASEGTTVSVDVRLTPPVTTASSVALAVGGSALKGTAKDYTTAAPASITFAPGEISKILTFTVLDDLPAEPDETIVLTLGTTTGGISLDTSRSQHTITIRDNEVAPSFVTSPVSSLLAQGSTGQWTAAAIGTPAPTLQWKRFTSIVPGGEQGLLTLSNISTARAGSYTVTAKNRGGIATASFEVAVADTTAKSYTVLAGSQITLSPSCAGNGLSYSWVRDGAPDSVLATTKALTLKPLTLSHTGKWLCRVSRSGTTPLEVPFYLTVFDDKPQLGLGITSPVTMPAAMVSELYAFDVRALWFAPDTRLTPTSFRATLPAGLSINAATGMILGRPSSARIVKGLVTPYSISITATNSKGSTTVTGSMLVSPLPGDIPGAWVARIPRHPSINGDKGGRVNFSVNSSGLVTASVQNGPHRYSVSQRINSQVGSSVGEVLLPLTKGGPSLNLHLTLNGGRITGTLENGADTAIVSGWRNPWSTLLATPLRGYHTFLINPSAAAQPGDLNATHGHGFGSFVISPSGTATITARLADGTACSSASSVSSLGEILFQSPLYVDSGAIDGILTVSGGATYQTVGGSVYWNRPSIVGKSVGIVFGPSVFVVEGSNYSPPATGTVFLNLPEPVTAIQANAHLSFVEGGLQPAFDAPLLIKRGNKAAFQAFPSDRSCTVTFVPSTGSFSGTLTAFDPNPATGNSLTKRTTKFYGMVIRNELGLRGAGWYLFPRLPVPPETVTKSPQDAGSVILLPQ